MTGRLVIVGAGQAGFAVAAKLRALKDTRPITLVGAEESLPYQRPPLTKKYLLGEMSFDRLMFRHEHWYAENDIDVRLSTWAEQIHRDKKQVVMQDGTALDYETLVLATGAMPRRLPPAIGGDLEGVYVARDKRDADLLSAEMRAGRRVLIIGGGYIGLEAAAVARHRGLEVSLIEMADRILPRVAAKETADIMRVIHQDHDVVIREKTGLKRLVGKDGRVVAAELSDGSTVEVDFVVVGIGVAPVDRLAKEAGLAVANGIVVDDYVRTSDPSIYAVGDCAALPLEGELVRLESVQNAVDQAEAAAAIIAGGSEPYVPKPWFWSDQYDVKLQIAGFNRGYDETVLRHGTREGSASVWYFKAGRLIAVDAINDARAYVTAKKLIDAGITPDRERLADAGADLKTLLV